MKCGSEVRIPTPTKASDIHGMLTAVGGHGAELYIRVESGKAILYAVKRLDDGRGVGTILASRPITMFPEEV